MKRKLFSLLLVALMCFAPVIATAATVNPEGLPIVDEPIELTVAVQQSPIQIDFNEIVILKDFAEASGITMKYTNIAAADRATQLSLMLASGEVPDILMKMAVTAADQGKYADEGLFLPLSDYAEYTPNLNRWFEEFPTAKEAMTQGDGKYYAAPYILAGYAIRMGDKMFFNSEVLEELGVGVPDTTDEFLDYLRAAKNLDYNGNGQADEIPWSSSHIDTLIRPLSGTFDLFNRGASHRNIRVNDEGELEYGWTSENFRDLLRFLKTCYEEKLLDQDIFTMDFAQLIAKVSTGRVLTYNFVNHSPSVGSAYENLAVGLSVPMTGPKGYKAWNNYSLPAADQGQFIITYKCQYPEAAARWIDHWYSDEGIIAYFMGVEGVTYEKDENSPGGLKLTDFVVNNPDGINFEQVLATYVPWAGGSNPSVATNEYFKGGETWPICLEMSASLIDYVPEIVWAPFNRYYTAEEASEMTQIWTEMENYLKEWRGYFVTGQRDLDTDWDAYVAGHANMNLDRYMEIYQKAYELSGEQ